MGNCFGQLARRRGARARQPASAAAAAEAAAADALPLEERQSARDTLDENLVQHISDREGTRGRRRCSPWPPSRGTC